VIDIKEYRKDQRIELILEKTLDRKHYCCRCGHELGAKKDDYRIKAKHLKMMGWQVDIIFWREKRYCPQCKKTRSEAIEFLSSTSPHVTMDLAWWLNRLTEITSVLAVSRLEAIDKHACYRV